jgi:hypothetical protein
MTDPDKNISRAEFFRRLGRYTVLAALGGGAAKLGRRQHLNRDKQRCINRSVCHGCSAYSACELPAATSAKQRKDI